MMRITTFWATGYRSLRDLRIDTDRAFNVFCGPNGAGKSNILAGIAAMFALAACRTRAGNGDLNEPVAVDASALPVAPDDRCALGGAAEMRLGATLEASGAEPILAAGSAELRGLSFEVGLDWEQRALRFTQLRVDKGGESIEMLTPSFALDSDALGEFLDIDPKLRELFRDRLPAQAYTLIGPDRMYRSQRDSGEPDPVALLRRGQLSEALYRAFSDPNPVIRKRFKRVCALLQNHPLGRPPFDIVRDVASRDIELREPLPATAAGRDSDWDLPLQRVGTGIAHVYRVLAQLILPGASTAGIEEPEAHLHLPTTGRHLRDVLVHLIGESILAQLFITTHSACFAMDEGGHHEVSYDAERGTQVQWQATAAAERT